MDMGRLRLAKEMGFKSVASGAPGIRPLSSTRSQPLVVPIRCSSKTGLILLAYLTNLVDLVVSLLSISNTFNRLNRDVADASFPPFVVSEQTSIYRFKFYSYLSSFSWL
jgi:hypothetical protein